MIHLTNTRELTIVPCSFKQMCDFVAKHHRHNKAPRGWKFGVGVMAHGVLVGVASAGRPVARSLDDGLTLEVNRTCTDGTRNANSKLYGCIRRAAAALGYRRLITYTQAAESGCSLRACGWTPVAELPARGSWFSSSVKLRSTRDPVGCGGVARLRWEVCL